MCIRDRSTIVADGNDDTLTVASGTGISLTTNATSDTLTITNTAPDQTVVLTAGTGISTSGTYPSFTITNTAPDRTVVLTGAGTTVVTGTYPNFTITSNDQYVGTVTSVATSAPITGGTITTSGTIGITQSTTSSDGYLSSTDWNTFNSKVGGSGTTNYVAKFTGSGTIGNSQIFDNGTNVGIGTATPDKKLVVVGDGAGTMKIGGPGVSGNYTAISLNGTLDIGNYNILSSTTDNHLYINRPTGNNIYFRVNNNDQAVITGSGNVGIGTTSPSSKLHVAGTVSADAAFADSGAYRILKPNGGVRTSASGTETGAIKITYPVGYTNTMHRVKLNVYEYITNQSFTIYFGGYPYAPGPQWYNEFAYILNNSAINRNFTVRFGYDGTKLVVYIGELSSTWSYPQFFIEEVELGYSGMSDTWRDGAWSIGLEASAFQGVNATVSNTQATNWARSGNNAYYSFGSVGIGTTTFLNSDYKFVVRQASNRNFAVASQDGELSLEPYNDTPAGIPMRIYGSRVSFPNGKVLVGTTTDSGYQLQVAGTSYFTGEQTILYNNAIQTMNGGSGFGLFRIYGNSNAVEFQMDAHSSNSGAGTIGTYSNSDVYIKTNNSNRVVVKAGGNVGIGTTSPANKLIAVSDASPTNENSYAIAAAAASDPAYKTVIGYDFTNDVGLIAAVRTGIGWRNISMPQGSLGLGVSSPTQKLHVAGNLRVTGAYYDSNNEAGTSGQVLTSTGSGTDWVTPATTTATSLYDLLPAARVAYNWTGQVVNDTWTDVFTSSTNVLTTGTWMVQMYIDDWDEGGGHYTYTYTGVMQWYQTTVNQAGEAAASEIYLHRMGHAANASVLYLRTTETNVSGGYIGKFQIKGNYSNTSNTTINFKFVKIF